MRQWRQLGTSIDWSLALHPYGLPLSTGDWELKQPYSAFTFSAPVSSSLQSDMRRQCLDSATQQQSFCHNRLACTVGASCIMT